MLPLKKIMKIIFQCFIDYTRQKSRAHLKTIIEKKHGGCRFMVLFKRIVHYAFGQLTVVKQL
jgi:hypothetical protein